MLVKGAPGVKPERRVIQGEELVEHSQCCQQASTAVNVVDSCCVTRELFSWKFSKLTSQNFSTTFPNLMDTTFSRDSTAQPKVNQARGLIITDDTQFTPYVRVVCPEVCWNILIRLGRLIINITTKFQLNQFSALAGIVQKLQKRFTIIPQRNLYHFNTIIPFLQVSLFLLERLGWPEAVASFEHLSCHLQHPTLNRGWQFGNQRGHEPDAFPWFGGIHA